MSVLRYRIRHRSNPAKLPAGQIYLGGYRDNLWVNNEPTENWGDNLHSKEYFLPSATTLSAERMLDAIQDFPYEDGGKLRLAKYELLYNPIGVHGSGTYPYLNSQFNKIEKRYEGGFYAPSEVYWGYVGLGFAPDLANVLLDNSEAFPDMTDWGNKAWKRIKPKVSEFGGFVALAEARDIPGMLKTTSRGLSESWDGVRRLYPSSSLSRSRGLQPMMLPEKAADHYLNHQFGWRPFVGDMMGLYHLMSSVKDKLNKLVKNNDVWTKREVTLLDEHSTVMDETHNYVNVLPFDSGSGIATHVGTILRGLLVDIPTVRFRRVRHTKIYAKGYTKYYRPEYDASRADFNSLWNTVQRYFTLYGIRANPSTIYQLVPWSWLIDWCSNVGDHIDSLTDAAIDGVIGKKCFVMRTVEETGTIIVTLPLRTGTQVLEFSRKRTLKQRDPFSSPFGFSLSWDFLSPRQLAILAALGISKGNYR